MRSNFISYIYELHWILIKFGYSRIKKNQILGIYNFNTKEKAIFYLFLTNK